jgi:dTDP-glucose 4,6-dehydratase
MKSEKIRKELQWSQKIDFKEGIKNTVKWYLDNMKWWKNISKDAFTSTPWKN